MDWLTELIRKYPELAAVEGQIVDLSRQRDELADEVLSLRTFRDRLRCEVSTLECQLESLSHVMQSGGSGDGPDGRGIAGAADEPLTVAGVGRGNHD